METKEINILTLVHCRRKTLSHDGDNSCAGVVAELRPSESRDGGCSGKKMDQLFLSFLSDPVLMSQ